jgi:hypothetical protein
MTFDYDKWAQKAVGKLQNAEDNERRDNDAFVIRQKMLATRTPRIWDDFSALLQRMTDAFNRQQKMLAIDLSRDVVTISCGNKTLVAEYDRQNHVIALANPACGFREEYQAAVITGKQDRVGLILVTEDQEIAPSDIAKRALDNLLGLTARP